jgi:hypothetical protein
MLKDNTVVLVPAFYGNDEIIGCMLGKKIFCICKRTRRNSSQTEAVISKCKFCEIRPGSVVTGGACDNSFSMCMQHTSRCKVNVNRKQTERTYSLI